jgi:hypothetical protein
MPVLNWTGRDAVVPHHAQVPFRLHPDANKPIERYGIS